MSARAQLQLLCFPYAGGNAQAYAGLKQALAGSAEVVTFEPPGHGARAREPLLRHMPSIVDDYLRQIEPRIFSGREYALFGHSMGALAAHLLCRRLVALRWPLPKRLFLSAKAAPGTSATAAPRYLLADADFRRYIASLGGSPRAVLEDDELMAYFIRILRADFEAIETADEEGHPPHTTPMTILAGAEDAIGRARIDAWVSLSLYPVRFRTFPGGHFFILDHWPAIARAIADDLT